ncbi:MAG: alpha-amylase family glycosyl hydrolase, partial [Oscillospiraceae bacterium]
RGIKLLIDLVMNHTSRDNEWFASAAESLRQQPCGADKEQECLSKTLCPVHNPYVDRGAAVERQLDDPDSILNYYKRALRIRNENPCIARGKTHVINITGQDVAAVRRTWEDESVVIVYNYSEEEKSINDELLSLDTLEIRGYLTVSSDQSVELDGELTMPPYSIVFLTNK